MVSQEKKLIEMCDVFICYLDDKISLGTISELVYAATLKKQIIVYYTKSNDIEYRLKTDSWFPITLVMQLTSVRLLEIK